MKHIVFCFDGTWNRIDGVYPTNVARIAQSVARNDDAGNPQIVHYDEGVGTTARDRWLVGMGLADRRFAGIDRTDLHPSLARRFHAAADELPERRRYRPGSLEAFWPVLEEMGDDLTGIGEAVPIAYKGIDDPRALRTPDSVRRYIIAPGDSLRTIAAREMGGLQDEAILFLHNRAIGRLFDPDRIFAGVEIEIPVYRKQDSDVAVATDADAKD